MKAKLVTADGAWRYADVPLNQIEVFCHIPPRFCGIESNGELAYKLKLNKKRKYIFTGKRDNDGAFIYLEDVEDGL
jgi:hypothetical protein